MKSAVLGLVFLVCFAVPAFSGEAKETPSSVLKDAFARVSFEELAVAEQAQTPGTVVAPAKDEWQKKLGDAQVKRSRGLRYTWFGVGGVLVGSIVAGASGSSYDYYLGRRNSAGFAIGAVMILGGAGLSGYGLYNWIKSSDEIDNLDREGRLKGYLSLLPERGGARVAMTFAF